MTLRERVDHMRNLSMQDANKGGVRVLHSKAGTRLSACWIAEDDQIVDTKAYWATTSSLDEAKFLTAIINSATVLARVVDLQPVGQRDPRDFDNLVWTLPIPEYDDSDPLHRDLAATAHYAAEVAAAVVLPTADHFTTKRRLIRNALLTDGIAFEIERLIDALLPF